ncbi:MAG: hypothetical protein ACW967_02035 [Candidatus Hodarchaeales archaeon]|jgi:hypothetical protein
MGRTLFIVSLFILLFAGATFFVGYFNVISPAQSSGDLSDSQTINTNSNSIGALNSFDYTYYPIYSQINVIFAFVANDNANLFFSLELSTDIGDPGSIGDISIGVTSGEQYQIEFSIYVYELFPLFLSPQFQKLGNTFNLNLVASTETGNVNINYLMVGKVYNKIIVPISLIIAVVGVVVLIAAIATRSRGPKVGKPLRYQAALYEPTLNGSPGQQSRSGGFGSKSKQKSPKPAKQSKKPKPTRGAQTTGSANRCNQCSKPVPRRAQYCPHCYARQ